MLNSVRNEMEHNFWSVPRVQYRIEQGRVVVIEPGVMTRTVSDFTKFVTDRMLTHHKGNVSYGLEVESWRPNRAHEEFSVSEGLYLALKPGDPVIVETHRGALGIPLLASVHLPN